MKSARRPSVRPGSSAERTEKPKIQFLTVAGPAREKEAEPIDVDHEADMQRIAGAPHDTFIYSKYDSDGVLFLFITIRTLGGTREAREAGRYDGQYQGFAILFSLTSYQLCGILHFVPGLCSCEAT